MKKLLFFFCPDCWRDRRACELIMIKIAAPSLMPASCSITLKMQMDDRAADASAKSSAMPVRPSPQRRQADALRMAENCGRSRDGHQVRPFVRAEEVLQVLPRALSRRQAVRFPVGNGRTCDAEMCNNCARMLGSQDTEISGGMKRLGDTIDVCPIHRNAIVQNGAFVEEVQP
jgi:hypothetical protein